VVHRDELRFEINAIPARWRIDYVEERLAAHGLMPKHVPPVDALERLVERYHEAEIRLCVEDAIASFVDVEAILAELVERFRGEIMLSEPEEIIRERFAEKHLNPWTTVGSREDSARARRKSA
jgi:hypothetical protein